MKFLWKRCSTVVYIFKKKSFIPDSAGGVVGGGGVVHWNGVQITQPHNIEVPRSLLDVVVSWNIPMHKWLKTCKYDITHFGSTTSSHKKPLYDVFLWVERNIKSSAPFSDCFKTTLRRYGSGGLAVFVTYAASTLLHGLNFQVCSQTFWFHS